MKNNLLQPINNRYKHGIYYLYDASTKMNDYLLSSSCFPPASLLRLLLSAPIRICNILPLPAWSGWPVFYSIQSKKPLWQDHN
jgi:hypothetical protein